MSLGEQAGERFAAKFGTVEPFVVVPIADLGTVEPAPPAYVWEGMVPAGFVTLLGAHGGVGKGWLALMLAVCVALGLPLFGIPTRRGRVAIYSAEDSAELVRYRLRLVCRTMGVDPADLAEWLHVLDATGGDPVLFHEIGTGARREGVTTPAMAALSDYVSTHAIDLVIIDNASDVYDANEIDRAKVRAFMRALARLARVRGSGVLLLAHVDKTTARGNATGSDSYSGSTAWNNSARSRLYVSRDKDGALLLQQEKHNLGRLRDPLRLVWPEGGIPTLDAPMNGFVQHIADGTDIKALVTLIHRFYMRGEWIATDPRSRYHAARVLGDEPSYPRRKPAEVFGLLRTAEARGAIERETYKDRYRREAVRWKVTPAGMQQVQQVQQVAAHAADAQTQHGACASAQVQR